MHNPPRQSIQDLDALPFAVDVYKHGYLTDDEMADDLGPQLPNISYPGFDHQYMMEMHERAYAHYYFCPRVIFRILCRAVFDREVLDCGDIHAPTSAVPLADRGRGPALP